MPGGQHYTRIRPKAMQKRWRRDWPESPEACADDHNSLGVNNIDLNVYVYTHYALSMAKLYWRTKKRDGKWTWVAAARTDCKCKKMNIYRPDNIQEEE